MPDMIGRILVVDDNKINRMMLSRALEAEGHMVTLAENGQQALDLLRATDVTPDLILLDILMPEMDGYELLQIVKADAALRHIPVIMISAVDEMESVIRCIEMGATDYLHKPFKPALLRARLNASLAEKRLRDLELEYLEQVGHVVSAAQAVESANYDPTTLDAVAAREDALGQLARVFQQMAQEVHLREQRLKQQLDRLRLDMDEMQRALSEQLYVYIPMDRRHALAANTPLQDRMDGAALFADISGFTPLTAALAREEGLKRGAEELTRLINQVYGALIAEIHRYHGSVVGFSGDAVTCWFDGDDGLTAAACGLAMQAAMAQFASVTTPSGTPVSLGIKVAVVSGTSRRFVVGDPGIHRVDVLAGRLLDALSETEHAAQRGEVVLHGAVYAALADRFTVKELRPAHSEDQPFAVISGLTSPVEPVPWEPLPPGSLTEEQCRPWMLPGVYEHTRTGTQQFLAELRSSAAVFLNFSGIDYDQDDHAGDKLDAFISWVQSVIRAYDGSLLQLTIGDKGSYIYMVFGAPVAHPDDAVRAVNAALALRSVPPELNYIHNIQIGVAQGQMRVGAYGSAARRTYGVLGEKVNLSARLMQTALDGILCDEQIYQAASTRLGFQALMPVYLKGIETPVPVYRPTGEKIRSARTQVRLIGRSEVRVRLREGLQQQSTHRGGVFILEGEAGIGKTRLLDEAGAQAEGMGRPVFRLSGRSEEKSAPLYAWRELFQILLNIHPTQSPNQIQQGLSAQLDAKSGEGLLAPLLNPVLPVVLPETELTASLKGQPRLNKTRLLLASLMKAKLPESAGVLLVDNAQDLDSESWFLLLEVARQIPALLLIIAARPLAEPLPAGYVGLQQLSYTQMLALKALSPDESYLLACEHLDVVSLPAPLIEILQKAAGNPFVIEELVYFLRDDGYLQVSAGTCTVYENLDLRNVAFPTTVQGVIINKIDQLSPSEQLVLKVASVIGRTFTRELLGDIFPVESDKPFLDRHLESLTRLELIAAHGPGTFAFRNVFTLETAYNGMLFMQRRHLHRQIAGWLEAKFASDLSPHYTTLAYHWQHAEEPTKAIHYLELAGQQAMQRGAFQEAEALLKQSLDLNTQSSVLSVGFYQKGT